MSRVAQRIVTGQRRFESASKRHAMQRGDHWLAASLEPQQHVVQQGLQRRVLEFADIGARYEVLAGAMQHDRLDGWVLIRVGQRSQQRRRAPGCASALTGGLSMMMQRDAAAAFEGTGLFMRPQSPAEVRRALFHERRDAFRVVRRVVRARAGSRAQRPAAASRVRWPTEIDGFLRAREATRRRLGELVRELINGRWPAPHRPRSAR